MNTPKTEQGKPVVVNFTILTVYDNPNGSPADAPIKIHSVKRNEDGQIFTVGDRVTNGTEMIGDITSFQLLEGHLYVNHTWSGVGMGLDDLTKIQKLPSRYQEEDAVSVRLKAIQIHYAKVSKVHFNGKKITYDLAIPIGASTNNSEELKWKRIHNIDEDIIEDFQAPTEVDMALEELKLVLQRGVHWTKAMQIVIDNYHIRRANKKL